MEPQHGVLNSIHGLGRLRGRRIWLPVALVAACLGTATVASAVAHGSGSTGKVDFDSSNVLIETPSGTFQKVTSMNVTTAGGPLVVRFDAQAYENDFNAGGSFDGTHYAAMLVRVTVDGTVVSPGGVRFTTNEGKRNIDDTNGQAASFSWATTVSAGTHTVEIDFRSLTTFDISGLVRWTLTADHG